MRQVPCFFLDIKKSGWWMTANAMGMNKIIQGKTESIKKKKQMTGPGMEPDWGYVPWKGNLIRKRGWIFYEVNQRRVRAYNLKQRQELDRLWTVVLGRLPHRTQSPWPWTIDCAISSVMIISVLKNIIGIEYHHTKKSLGKFYRILLLLY